MNTKALARAVRGAGNAYGKNPVLLVPALALFAIMVLLRELSQRILPYLQTNAANLAWTIGAALLQLALLAIAFSALLSLAVESVRNRRHSLTRTRFVVQQSAPALFILLLITLAATIAVFLLALGLGNLVDVRWGGEAAALVAALVYVSGMAGGVSFLAFSTIVCIAERKGAGASIRASAVIVKRNYGSVLLISALLLGIVSLVARFTPPLLQELIHTFIILPYLALFLVFFLQEARSS